MYIVLSAEESNTTSGPPVFRAMFKVFSYIVLSAEESNTTSGPPVLFHEGIQFSMEKLGHPNRELRKEQYDAIRSIVLERKDVLAVLRTGFGKSLIYQVLPSIFDFVQRGREPEKEESLVIVVSPLNALMRDQVQKLEQYLNVCILQIADEEGQKSDDIQVPNNLHKCSLVFGHPEVFVDCRNETKILRTKEFQRRVQAIVVDEAHLVHQWYL